MPNVKNNAAAQETKRKLLEAAGEVFAELGFERGTIKDITTRAGVSVASVNYHFSDKYELYLEVVRMACEAGLKASSVITSSSRTVDARKLLHEYVSVFLGNLLDPERPAWYGAIVNREIRMPSALSDKLIDELFRPHTAALESLVERLVSRRLARSKQILLCDSILSQCVYFVNHQMILQRMYPELPPPGQRIKEIADHITRFTLAAIDGLYGRPS